MQDGADVRSFSWTHQGPLIVNSLFFNEQDFKAPASARIAGAEPRGDDAGIVQHKDIAWAQILQQIGKMAMPRLARRAVKNKEARKVALRKGLLGDQLRRQEIIEIRRAH